MFVNQHLCQRLNAVPGQKFRLQCSIQLFHAVHSALNVNTGKAEHGGKDIVVPSCKETVSVFHTVVKGFGALYSLHILFLYSIRGDLIGGNDEIIGGSEFGVLH